MRMALCGLWAVGVAPRLWFMPAYGCVCVLRGMWHVCGSFIVRFLSLFCFKYFILFPFDFILFVLRSFSPAPKGKAHPKTTTRRRRQQYVINKKRNFMLH